MLEMLPSGAILESYDACMLGAVSATEDGTILLDAVADHLAATVRASRCQGMDRTLEGVKGMRIGSHLDGECLVVVVPTHVTDRHRCTLEKCLSPCPAWV